MQRYLFFTRVKGIFHIKMRGKRIKTLIVCASYANRTHIHTPAANTNYTPIYSEVYRDDACMTMRFLLNLPVRIIIRSPIIMIKFYKHDTHNRISEPPERINMQILTP